MVTVGFAVTVAHVVQFNPVAGDHTYVFAPLAVILVEPPTQIGVGAVIAITGFGFTVTVTVACAVHPPTPVPVTVYVVVAVGFAVTFAPVVELNPVGGLHK